MYFATVLSYFSGFANLIFVICPLVFFFWDIAPVRAWNTDFFFRFIPFFVLNRLMFHIAAEGIPVRKGEQYTLALFPLWIKAVFSVVFQRKIAFAVTPKTRRTGKFISAIKVQLGVIAITVAGLAFAIIGLGLGWRSNYFGVLVNAFWGCYNLWQLMVIVRAALYSPPKDWNPQPPCHDSIERKAIE